MFPFFKYWDNFPVLGLSKEVYIYNVFLGQLAQKWQVNKVRSANDKMFYCDLYNKMKYLLMLLSLFKIYKLAIFEPVDLGRGCINLLEALKEKKLTHYLKMG